MTGRRVVAVDLATEWTRFASVPHALYRDDPCWISDSDADLRTLLGGDRDRFAFQAYVAQAGTEPLGRVLVLVDRRYNDHHDDRTAFFGFFEAIDDDEVVFGLLDAAADWARERSLCRFYGPVNPSMAHSAGVLVRGFGRPPLVGMPYNPPHYGERLERWGLRKAQDLNSYEVADLPALWSSRKRASWERWLARSGETFRSMRPRRFAHDVETVRTLYNTAFGGQWGFVPLDVDEFRELAGAFRPILDEDLVVFAEREGVTTGFLLAVPDINRARARANRVRGGLARTLVLLWCWRGPRRRATMRHARMDLFMLDPDRSGPATAAGLVFETLRRLHDKGYVTVEAAPVLETSTWIRSVRPFMELVRVHRVYVGKLAAGAESGPAADDGSAAARAPR